jgi:putative ABC transport system permease protein
MTLRGLVAHKRRLVTTALAVALGVAFIAGTFVLTDTINQTFNKLFATVYKGTDAVVRAKSVFDGPNGTGAQRGRVDASLVSTLAGVPGVSAAEGQIFGYARLIAKDGHALGTPGSGAPTLGGNWTANRQLNSFRLVSGRPPQTDDEIVVDKKSARDGNLKLGDTTTVLVQGPPLTVHIVGIATFGTSESPGGASVVLFTTPAAQRYVAEPGKFDSIALVASKGLRQSQLVAAVSPVLPLGTEAVTGQQVTKENQTSIRKALSFFSTFLLVFAIVALLVGGFMIFNTFSITVAQRTRESGLLRALGATRQQLRWSIVTEALVIGAIASVLGLGFGLVVAAGLKAAMAGIGIGIPAGSLVFAARTAAVALVAGIGVTVFASLSPARKASKVSPMAAMHEGVAGSTGYGSKQRVLVGAGLLAVGCAVLFYGLFRHPANAVAVAGFGMFVVFFGVSVLGRTVSLPLSQVLAYPVARIRGVSGELARENAMRNPKRTAASASALMIGVGLVTFMTILASSTKASINATIDRAFTGDYVIDSGAGLMGGGLDPGLAAQLNRTPGVAAATGLRAGPAQIDGKVVILIAVDPATAVQLFDVKPLEGAPKDLGRDAIAIYKDVATQKHLRIGDTIPVVFKDTGAQRLRVALIYGERRPAGDYFLGIAASEANYANHYDTQIFVKKSPGTSAAAGLAAVTRVSRNYPGATVLDQTGYKREQAKPINQLLALVYVLLALAILIALLGIGNTLALSIYERTRELGLLRAVGMTRRQLRTAIRWESVVIALQGTTLGLVIGLFFGWSLVRALSRQGIDQFSVPLGSLLAVVVLAGVAGVAAAVLPSRRAARLNVLAAIGAE